MTSIIDDKYKGKVANDWLTSIINNKCTAKVTKTVTKKDPEGNETTEEVTLKKTRVDIDALFALARENNINVDKFEEQRDRPNAPGRIRMTVGNMLRAAAKKRHGLFVDGEWTAAPSDFHNEGEPTENQQGHKIVKAKPKAEETENAEAA